MMRAGEQDSTVQVTCDGVQTLYFCSKGLRRRFIKPECKLAGVQKVLLLNFGGASGPHPP